MTLNIGLVGCGGVSGAHHDAMKCHDDAQLIACCDPDESKARQTAEQLGGRHYSTMEQMLDEEPLHGVILCTPPSVRTELIEAAARRGLPVLCEKPPAVDLAMARRTEEVIRRHDAMVSIGFLFRYLPVVDRLRELLAGRPVAYVRSRYLGDVANNAWFQQSKPWYLLKEKSGGPILDQAIHVLDVIRFLFGDAGRVTAQGSFRTKPQSETNTVADTVCLQFTTSSGVLASHCHCWGCDRWLDEMEVTGADFSFVMDLNGQRLYGTNRGEEVAWQHGVNGYAAEQRAWLNAIHCGDRSLIRSTHADAVKSLALCLAANISIESGLPERVESM